MNWLRKLSDIERMAISYVVVLPVVFGMVLNGNVPDQVWIPSSIVAVVLVFFIQLW